MNQNRIDAILRSNEDRVTLFASDYVMVYGTDCGLVCSAYEQGAHINGGVRYPVGEKHRIAQAVQNAGFLVTVVEDLN